MGEIMEGTSETTQPETDAPLDRAEWYAGEPGDLIVGEPGQEPQLDCGSLLGGARSVLRRSGVRRPLWLSVADR